MDLPIDYFHLLSFLFFSNCERLDILVNKEPPSKRHHSKIRVDQLKYDVQQIQTSLNAVAAKQREWERRERDRDELLSTRLDSVLFQLLKSA